VIVPPGFDSERGQILPLLALGLAVVLLGVMALVLDVGRALLAQRHLQASADAAALAGAQLLPDAPSAVTLARAYAADPANLPRDTNGVATTVSTRCLQSTPQCTSTSPNVLAVTEQATVSTTFGRVLGIDTFTVKVTSTASQSVSTKPLDVALVLDRTGSMSGQMSNLRAGAAAFLDALDPTYDRVALVVLPPVPAGGDACTHSSRCDYYPLGNGGYVVEHLTSDFARLKSDVGGLPAAGSTSYKQALAAAAAELRGRARVGAEQVIVFETDGAANAAPDDAYVQPTSWLDLGQESIPTGTPASGRTDDVNRPCGSAVAYAATTGVAVYTVGFHLSSDQTCYQAPHSSIRDKDVRESGIGAPGALLQMAELSGGSSFLQEDGSKLAQTFAQVATQLQPARLVADAG
jgi:Flp pilus assembly protein TadG